jgi:hypothetical protein
MLDCFPPDPLRLEVVLPIFAQVPVEKLIAGTDTIPLPVDACTPALARLYGMTLFQVQLGKREGQLAVRVQNELCGSRFSEFLMSRLCQTGPLPRGSEVASCDHALEIDKCSGYAAAVQLGSCIVRILDISPGSVFTLDSRVENHCVLELCKRPVASGSLMISMNDTLMISSSNWLLQESDLRPTVEYYSQWHAKRRRLQQKTLVDLQRGSLSGQTQPLNQQ